MTEKENKKKQKPKKQQPWNSFAYLASLGKKKESVVIYRNGNTVKDVTLLKGIIGDVDNRTLAFLTNDGRELPLFKHAVRFIEKLRGK